MNHVSDTDSNYGASVMTTLMTSSESFHRSLLRSSADFTRCTGVVNHGNVIENWLTTQPYVTGGSPLLHRTQTHITRVTQVYIGTDITFSGSSK